jgi:hypothetical protein
MLLDYAVPLPSGIALSREPWASAVQAAGDVDPTWKESEYQSRLAARKSFTSGADAKNINGINTAIGHLKTLKDAGADLGNSPWPLVNKVGNYYATAAGKPKVVRFETAANAVVNELASVFKGTGATDQEIQAWRKTISASNSPDQLNGAIKQAVELLGSRMQALTNKWEQSQGKPMDMKILSPKSRLVLKSMGLNANEYEPAAKAPAAAAPASAAPAAGEQTAVNPTTGQRLVLRGGQWVPAP